MPLPAYDYCLLDLDGTLVDIDFEYARGVFDRVGDRLDYSFSDEQVELLWYGLKASRNDLLREWGIDVEAFWTCFHDEEDPQARASATVLYDDAVRFLEQTHLPLGVVTHCQGYLTEPILHHLDLYDRFGAVVCCSDETGWKPDPRPVSLATEQLGVASNGHRGVLIGDGPQDIGAAWNAGLDGIHIERHGTDARGHCVMGDRRISALTDLGETGR